MIAAVLSKEDYASNSEAGTLMPGICVQLTGLVARPDLNGEIGIINGQPIEDRAGDAVRWPVALQIDGETQEANLKLANMEPAPHPPGWYEPPQCPCGLIHIGDQKAKACMPIRDPNGGAGS